MKINRLVKMVSVVATVAFMLVAVSAWSQEDQAGQSGEHRGQGRMMPSPQERTDHLTKALNLTDDQKAKVLSAYQDEQKQMEGVRSDTSLSREDRRTKMRQIHESTNSQIKGTLNPDQAKRFDDMQQKMAQHHEQGEKPAPPQQQ